VKTERKGPRTSRKVRQNPSLINSASNLPRETTILVTLFFSCISAAVGFYAGSEINPGTARVYSLPTAAAPKETLRIGIVDMKRLFEAHPRAVTVRAEFEAKYAAAMAELKRLTDSGDRQAANDYRNSRNEEFRAESQRLQREIFRELETRALNTATRRNLDLVLDSSVNHVKFVFRESDVIDLTDEMSKEFK
jgi:Skp family chaperone for outer membrane proteins